MIGKVNVYLKPQLKQTPIEFIQKNLLEQYKKKLMQGEFKNRLLEAVRSNTLNLVR